MTDRNGVGRGEQMDLQTMQVQQMAERRFTDMMSSAGVSHGRMAQELLYFLPRDFVNIYSEVFYQAYGGSDTGGNGGSTSMGENRVEQAAVGKASGKGLQGLGGAKRKTYKKYWVIADENAVEIKEKADKRLRALARDMRLGIAEKVEAGEGRLTCNGCRRFLEVGWGFCPNCGSRTDEP